MPRKARIDSLELAMNYPSQEISLQKLLGQLQDSGNVTTIKHYLELLEGAYLLKALQKYSDGLAAFISKYPDSVPLLINRDNGSMLLATSLVTNELLDSL